MIKVSVIIPMYNVENYIGTCVESICEQTLKELEVICIDDGSEDQTAQVVKKLQEKDQRIVYIYQENNGVSASRNAGLNVAKGEFVAFLDSDDYLAENALEVLYAHAKDENLDELFYSAESFFDSEELQEKQNVYKDYYERHGDYQTVCTGQQMFVTMHNNKEFKPSVCLQFWKRNFIEKNHLRFCEGIIHEDNLFTIEAMAISGRVMFLNEPLYMRRVRENSIMTKEKAFQNAYGYFRVACEMMKYASKYQLNQNVVYWKTYLKRMRIMCDMAGRSMRESKQDAIEFLNKLSIEEQQMFNVMILNGEEIRGRMHNDSEHKLQMEKKIAAEILEQKKQKEMELEAVRKSLSYQLGRLITWIPRGVKEWIKNEK